MAQRVVVTGSRAGREGAVADDDVDAVDMGGIDIAVLYEGVVPTTVPNEGARTRNIAGPAEIRFPTPGEVLVATFSVPPRSSADPDDGPVEFSSDRPGYHASETVDVNIVLNGEIAHETEDGSEILLRRGECIVVNGTGHVWHNRGDEPVTVLSVALGAKRAGAGS